MDRQYIDDRHVVARYLADQLSDSEREEFEAFCAKNPELFRELEATARFKAGLARLAESGELAAALEKPAGFGTFVFRHAASLAAIGFGIALLLGAVFTLRVPAMGESVAEVSGRFRSALPVVAVTELMRMRDSDEIDLRVTLPATPTALHFRVLPDAEGSAAYRAELSQESASSAKLIASADDLRPGEKQFVSFYVNSAKLVPGMYLLTVVPQDSKTREPASSFRIDVRDGR